MTTSQASSASSLRAGGAGARSDILRELRSSMREQLGSECPDRCELFQAPPVHLHSPPIVLYTAAFRSQWTRHRSPGAIPSEGIVAKILVTGSAGFISFHLTRRLAARGDQVIGYDNVNDYYSVALKEDRLKQLAALPGFQF